MALFEKDLTVFHDDNSSFVDFSFDANKYGRDDFDLQFIHTEDALYLGLYKPFEGVYIEMKTTSSNDNTLTAEFFNGTSFTSVENFLDQTKGLTRSGFLKWKRNQDDWSKTTINGEELFWIKLTMSASPEVTINVTTKTGNSTTQLEIQDADISQFSVNDLLIIKDTVNGTHFATVTAVDTTSGSANVTFSPAASSAVSDNTVIAKQPEIQGLNIVFSDDQDLKQEFIQIDNLLNDRTSFILLHEAARDEIIQRLRNLGKVKFDNEKLVNIEKWDINKLDEIRQPSKFLVLSKIFFEVSDNVEDKWMQRHKDYKKKFQESFDLFWLSLDLDDDGIADEHEFKKFSRHEFRRV